MNRSLEKEMMDLPGNPPHLHEEDLNNLRTINRSLGAYRGLLRCLKQVVGGRKTTDFSLLDVGTGCGDIPVTVVQWARPKWDFRKSCRPGTSSNYSRNGPATDQGFS